MSKYNDDVYNRDRRKADDELLAWLSLIVGAVAFILLMVFANKN